jgi:SAM-dependent methyltransferase
MTGSPAPGSPSPWVVRFASLVPSGSDVLDVACGDGRHTRLFLERGNSVVAMDVDTSGISDLARHPNVEALQVDLEQGGPPPFEGRLFGGVVVTNYLYRPLMPALVGAVAPGGALIYETYARGQERFGRPTNPDFLLRPGELLDVVRGRLRVVAYEDVVVDEPKPTAVQRICAIRD